MFQKNDPKNDPKNGQKLFKKWSKKVPTTVQKNCPKFSESGHWAKRSF